MIKKHRDWNWKIKRKEDKHAISLEEREKKKEKINIYRWQAAHQPPSHAVLGGRGRKGASNDMVKKHIWPPGDASHATQKV